MVLPRLCSNPLLAPDPAAPSVSVSLSLTDSPAPVPHRPWWRLTSSHWNLAAAAILVVAGLGVTSLVRFSARPRAELDQVASQIETPSYARKIQMVKGFRGDDLDAAAPGAKEADSAPPAPGLVRALGVPPALTSPARDDQMLGESKPATSEKCASRRPPARLTGAVPWLPSSRRGTRG